MKFKKLEKLVKKNAFKYDYFSSKIRVIYNKQNLTAHLRIKKDSIIWISLTGPFGIEGARIIISKDHFEMIDRLNRNYYNKPLSYIKNYFPIALEYEMLEKLIMGNFIEKSIKRQKIETKQPNYTVKGDIANTETKYIFDVYAKLQKIDIQGDRGVYGVEIDYSNYQKIGKQNFSFRRKYTLRRQKEENLLDLKFYKTKNEELEFPFDVPSGYAYK